MNQFCDTLPIRLVAGLGNPGSRYAGTRHNLGFHLVDLFAEHHGAQWKRSFRYRGYFAKVNYAGNNTILLKPQTFMNASGRSIQSVLKHLKLDVSQLLCICDDINMETGRLKLTVKPGDAGHNGIRDIRRILGDGFARLRVGVGQKTETHTLLSDWVLSPFTESELATLQEQSEFYRNSIERILSDGPILAMNTINQK